MKYTKQTYPEVWASAGSKTTPASLKIQTGWTIEKPVVEYMNWLQNKQDTMLAYINQQGIVEWDNSTEYQNGSSFIQYNGVVYKSIQTGTNKQPDTQPTYWAVAFDNYGDAQDVQDNLDAHIIDYGTLEGLTSANTARGNLDVYSTSEVYTKAEAAEKNGDAGETFDVADATTNTQAISKQQFDAKTAISTDTVAGIVEKATQAEMNAGTANKWPDAATVFNGFSQTSGSFKFPDWMGGWLVQWGYTQTGDLPDSDQYNFTQSFPDAYTSSPFVIICGFSPPGGSNAFSANLRGISAVDFDVVMQEWYSGSQGTYTGFQWLAIGK